MPVLSAKRQITLPKELCDRLIVQPGDDLSFLEFEGRITIIKKVRGSSDGILKHIKANKSYADEQSLSGTVTTKHAVRQTRKHAA